MKYFEKDEFNCTCCDKNEMSESFIDRLDTARGTASVPFRISSGYRCSAHNAEVGGKPTSSHLKGLAADINVISSLARFNILRGLIFAGFKRIGIGSNFIHVDEDQEKAQEVTWLY